MKIYVSALQKEFGHLAEFFADLYGGGGGIIGIVWRERKISSRPFTVSSSRGMKMSEEGNKFVVVDRAAVLQEMCSMGGRLVRPSVGDALSAFDMADTNGDGVLSREEFDEWLEI